MRSRVSVRHLSYSEIGAQLTREDLMPPVGSKWLA
jgi:hypothetical protein